MTAVNDISFSVEEGEILVIVGGSGCGKTTTLRCIAGLETPSSGSISIDGQTVAGDGVFVPPESRGIRMVFQSYALWPHKTVSENIAYSLVVNRTPKADIPAAVERALALVGLKGMGDRFPSTLSGGQQQRVALARCAISEPRVLLLDEPLSNLDAKLREQMRDELRYLITKIQSTAVHITHDQTEAIALADRIVCMRNGRIEQIGTGRELYRRPANRFVADFIGITSFLDGALLGLTADGAATIQLLQGGSQLISSMRPLSPVSGLLTVSIRPESFRLSRTRPEGPNVLEGTVTAEVFLGSHIEYAVSFEGSILKCHGLADFPIGSTVFAQVDPNDVVYFAREETQAIAA